MLDLEDFCLELDIFENDGLDKGTDAIQEKVPPQQTDNNLQILKTILKYKQKLMETTVDVEGITVDVRDCLQYGKIIFLYPGNKKLKDMFSEENLKQHNAKIVEGVLPQLTVSDFTSNTDEKLKFILSTVETSKPKNVKLLADSWPFKRDVKDVFTEVIGNCCLAFLTNAFEKLFSVEFQSNYKLSSSLELKLEPQDFPKKYYDLGYSLFCTKMTLLYREKQKILKQLKHFRDQFKNQKRNDSSSIAIPQITKKLEYLENKYQDPADVFNKIKCVLHAHKYTMMQNEDQVLPFLMDVLQLVEHEKPVEWPTTSYNFIVSPLAKVKAALYELKGAVSPHNTQVTDLLNHMHAEVQKRIIVKNIEDMGSHTSPHVPAYSPDYTTNVSCFIVNNIGVSQKKKRWGAVIDEANIVDIFTQMEYSIFSICRNMELDDFKEKLGKWKEELRMKNFKSLVLVVMSHGGQENDIIERSVIQFDDGKTIAVQNILDMFTFKNFPVPDMPKIFLFQICRGKKESSVLEKSSTDEASENILNTFPNVSDTLVAYGTAPGYLSYRHFYAGTLFISELCDVFRKHAYNTHLQDMLIIVNERMRHRLALGNKLQTCCFENYGFKHFYFKKNVKN